MWLSVVTLCISIIKRSKLSKGKYKMFSLRIKGAPGNVMLNPSAVVKEIKFHKMLNVKLNKVYSVQHPAQLSFQLVKSN